MLWPDDISEDNLKRIKKIYTQNEAYYNHPRGICFEARIVFCEFLEENFLQQNLERYEACRLINLLLEKMNEHVQNLMKSRAMDRFSQKRELSKNLDYLKATYANDDGRVQLYKTIYKALMTEKDILNQHQNGIYLEVQQNVKTVTGNVAKVLNAIDKNEQASQILTNKDDQNKTFRQQLEDFKQGLTQENEVNKEEYLKALTKLEKRENDAILDKGLLEKEKMAVLENLKEVLLDFEQVLNDVVQNHLEKWRKEQWKNDCSNRNGLKIIQTLCEDLAESILLLHQKIVQINWESINTEDILLAISNLFSVLVIKSFVIKKQPPQVIRTGSNFKSTVVSLIGSKIFDIAASPLVTVSLISGEDVAKMLNTEIPYQHHKLCEIMNNTGRIDNGNAKVKFRNLQLKSGKKNDGGFQHEKRTGPVADNLYSIVFHTKFECLGIQFELRIPSVPVAVIQHDSQKMKALATIVWANAGDHPFERQLNLPWGQVFHALSSKWENYCGKSLTLQNKHYLACKAFQSNNLDPNEVDNLVLDLDQFKNCHLPQDLPTFRFSFWAWFYSMLDLTQKHLEPIWREGYVVGFASKTQVEEMLRNKQNGTFLLRFSDSRLGGISIASKDKESNRVKHHAPFTTEDLKVRGIVDMIFDIDYLTHLYPDKAKGEAFERFKLQAQLGSESYVSIILKAVPIEDTSNILDQFVNESDLLLATERLNQLL